MFPEKGYKVEPKRVAEGNHVSARSCVISISETWNQYLLTSRVTYTVDKFI